MIIEFLLYMFITTTVCLAILYVRAVILIEKMIERKMSHMRLLKTNLKELENDNPYGDIQ